MLWVGYKEVWLLPSGSRATTVSSPPAQNEVVADHPGGKCNKIKPYIKLRYKFNVTPNRVSGIFLVDVENLILKFTWKGTSPIITSMFLKKKLLVGDYLRVPFVAQWVKNPT